MFTVKREIRNYVRNYTVGVKTYEYEDLSDAIEAIEKLRKADLARYTVLMSKHPKLFYDDSHNSTGYYFIVGNCEISCEIEGVYEDAYKEFFMDCQLKEK